MDFNGAPLDGFLTYPLRTLPSCISLVAFDLFGRCITLMERYLKPARHFIEGQILALYQTGEK
jgi:hypothetical protein